MKQQHLTIMQRLWQSFEILQAVWIRTRAFSDKLARTSRARIITSCRSLTRKTARTRSKPRPSIVIRHHRFCRSMTSPRCLHTPEPSSVKNEKHNESTKVKKDTPYTIPKPAFARQGKANKKGNPLTISQEIHDSKINEYCSSITEY